MFDQQDPSLGVAALLHARQGSGRRGLNNHTFSASSSSTMTMPQNIFTNPAIQPSSVINLSNSTDVVIGPMTQYQGPVSIYYMDASMQTAAGINSSNTPSGSSSNSSSSNHNSNNHDNDNKRKSKRLTRNSLLLSLLVLLVLITAIVIVYVELNRTHFSALGNNKSIYFGNTYEDGTFPNLGNGHLVIERVQWGASEHAQLLTVPLTSPIPYVLITHIGVQSTPCTNLYRCSIKMRTIQDSAIAEKNLPDIQSNFYVSDEGNIYVGRGWDWANTYANHTLAITFMGDYGRYTPTAKQLEGVGYLLAHAVANRKLDFNYKLVAQNQTKTSKSPGVNVYREIMRWSHFYPCNMMQEPKCGSELGMTAESWNGAQ
ncbi:peptidoglycan-recognition protein LA isoform X1 [Drosophila sulfurigaster albostrigata]|uniref:peptidoglycan-recognition protein LA isoform X1 n=1 Tax=Drosophila sulfurigaster albostrigata TaxID=89887 RepID=UPI002D21BF89|nr:peptidoglycan-recognition protein LA isoform X1 [Drosophila sulfurigaster albostrigata]